MIARLVGGAAQRRLDRTDDARVLLEAALADAIAAGAVELAGFALAELGQVELAEGAPALAAGRFEAAAARFSRGGKPELAVEAAALALACHVTAGDLRAASALSPRISDDARAVARPDLIAFVDGAIADAAIATAPDAAVEACALAAESADAVPESPLACDLRAQARLRLARASFDASDRARHAEAGFEMTRALPEIRAGLLLGAHLVALVEARVPDAEIQRACAVTAATGDAELRALALDVSKMAAW